jgi:hypothetical protein
VPQKGGPLLSPTDNHDRADWQVSAVITRHHPGSQAEYAGSIPVIRSEVRSARDHGDVSRLCSEITLDILESAAPWRTFRWWKGQRHYSAHP